MSEPATPDGRLQAAAALTIDPDRSNIVLLVGTKGSGKSEAARVIFDGWPYDRAVVDITGDARPDDPDTLPLTAPFPASMERARELAADRAEDGEPPARVTAWLRVDPRSPTLDLDQDAALAVGLFPRHQHALVLVDEFGRMATATKIPPNVDLALMSSRHHNLTLLLCCPRPRRIPTLTIEQADLIFIFDTPNSDDRDVLAKNMGYPAPLFEQHYAATMARAPHSFLLWDKRQKRLFGCPPLPLAATHGPRA